MRRSRTGYARCGNIPSGAPRQLTDMRLALFIPAALMTMAAECGRPQVPAGVPSFPACTVTPSPAEGQAAGANALPSLMPVFPSSRLTAGGGANAPDGRGSGAVTSPPSEEEQRQAGEAWRQYYQDERERLARAQARTTPGPIPTVPPGVPTPVPAQQAGPSPMPPRQQPPGC